MCTTNVEDPLKPRLQYLQRCVFSPVCVRVCFVSSFDWQKAFEQTEQTYGFSPVWIRMWAIRLLEVENFLSHILQQCGFSPVCVRMCFSRSWSWRQARLHIVHWNGRSSLCTRKCTFRLPLCENPLSQILHRYGKTVEWILRWRANFNAVENCLLQIEHVCELPAGFCLTTIFGFAWILIEFPSKRLAATVCKLESADWIWSESCFWIVWRGMDSIVIDGFVIIGCSGIGTER